ncbi:MAG: hypothetical protein U0Q16_20150 [Bryobacteraceae bacterium]
MKHEQSCEKEKASLSFNVKPKGGGKGQILKVVLANEGAHVYGQVNLANAKEIVIESDDSVKLEGTTIVFS